MKKVCTVLILMIATTGAWASKPVPPSLTNACAQRYAEAAFSIRTRGSLFKDIVTNTYDGHSPQDMLGKKNGNIAVAGITVGLPIVWSISKIQDVFDKAEARADERMAGFIEQDGSRRSKQGMTEMYRVATKDFTITKEEFADFVTHKLDRNSFCTTEPDLGLSEKGKQIVGNQSFFNFAYQTINQPEWKEFWNDATNFETIWAPKALLGSERNTVLLGALRTAGFLEEPMKK
jgi:hypothetical protein